MLQPLADRWVKCDMFTTPSGHMMCHRRYDWSETCASFGYGSHTMSDYGMLLVTPRGI